ncbi:unnamed protein product [Acanthoscelides obtectus]|uniref:Uncharacterized protein n=1 Tax=Acanthoscelides obtectus TaxID=200917 RepID=A0A9P0P552_ACAOB|nr:unnamed protein product [Acanthoscelides obtectus]CAK1629296.1 hypothetical protein AOBTE_LOCUS5663 [Acanthoscelides obtectus]
MYVYSVLLVMKEDFDFVGQDEDKRCSRRNNTLRLAIIGMLKVRLDEATTLEANLATERTACRYLTTAPATPESLPVYVDPAAPVVPVAPPKTVLTFYGHPLPPIATSRSNPHPPLSPAGGPRMGMKEEREENYPLLPLRMKVTSSRDETKSPRLTGLTLLRLFIFFVNCKPVISLTVN